MAYLLHFGSRPTRVGEDVRFILVRAVICGWVGSVVAGVLVGLVGYFSQTDIDTVIKISAAAGTGAGIIGLGLPFARRVMESGLSGRNIAK